MKTIEDYLKALDQLEVPDVEPTRALAAAERESAAMLLETDEEPEEEILEARDFDASEMAVPAERLIGKRVMMPVRRREGTLFRGTAELKTVKPPVLTTYPSQKERFVRTLTALLSSLPHYKKVYVQSIRRQEGTRIPVSVVTFTYGTSHEQRIGTIFVKDYRNQQEIRLKDTAIPTFLRELKVAAPRVIGYDAERGFDKRLALLEAPVQGDVFLDNVGSMDYTNMVKCLGPVMLAATGKNIVSLLVEMQLQATIHLDMLEKKYGVKLEDSNHKRLIEERLLQYLKAQKGMQMFRQAYAMLEGLERGKAVYFCHGDFTTNNLRCGSTLNEFFPIDFEMARMSALPADDLAMFTVFTLSQREEDRDAIYSRIANAHAEHYLETAQKRANQLGHPELAPDIAEQRADFMLEQLRSHIYKIGDQIWTQERYGESDSRKFRARWHLINALRIMETEAKKGGECGSTMREMSKATTALLKSCTNVPYLQDVLKH